MNSQLPPPVPVDEIQSDIEAARKDYVKPNKEGLTELAPIQGPLLGPSLGPVAGPSAESKMGPAAEEIAHTSEKRGLDEDDNEEPLSPYSKRMNRRRELTMPPVPNFDIPPPPQQAAPLAVERKFLNFLKIKRRGMHLNQNLEAKHEFKDPEFMDKQLKFLGLNQETQYNCTLSKDALDMDWPESAYHDKYAALVKAEMEAREQAKLGHAREFVVAAAIAKSNAAWSSLEDNDGRRP